MKVIGVSGMPGSGKGVVSQIAHRMGMRIIRMGDVIRDEAKKRNEDVGKTAVTLRKEFGDYIVAEKCVEKIKLEQSKADSNVIFMIEGIRSPYELDIFRNNFNEFIIISVFSNPKTRFKRLKRRKRSDDFSEFSEFQKRDKRELCFGIGEVIATSDYLIVNEGPLWRFKNQVKRILRHQNKNVNDETI
ncbi:AAA family ATPase [Methanobacterium alcaliphilum]|uniref:AAA family ATPase n=1 Tax=Methanobacterium alcaliphilum TaxID=392018 RepID=UPI00200A2C4B|nr:AAA family ATPase [Methanobacterium alcaliphilum]MCK9150639.1 AAA family ATPase [Methanobacterium alcaliphilum]